ncbi:MAG: flagellar hook assembly protein FlgD [Alphaproteobacteria bacterium]|nr:flagellar hook assembly protein FlgD [Alphaproteobacteria bacterium]
MTTTNNILGTGQGTGVAEATKASKAKDQLAADMNQFLTLLTTQLANQDPLSPMDSTEFTNQLVQYANVEQNIQTNENLENLIAVQQSAMTLSSANYIGKTVSVATDVLPLQGGKATFGYSFDAVPEQATVVITNSSGNIVKVLSPDLAEGTHAVEWDGKDDNGTQLADGAYKVQIMALKANGDAVTSDVVVTGKVTGVSVYGGEVTLKMGSASASLADVQSIDQSL